MKNTQTKVQIGGGKHALEGYLNIDIIPPANLVYDIRKGIPLDDSTVELIFTEHLLEHLEYPRSVKNLIKECHRVLKPRGKLIVGVPDSEKMIRAYVKRDPKFFKKLMKLWYSKRDIVGDINTYIDLLNLHFRDQYKNKKYSQHLWAYDKEKLTSLFKEVGFRKVKKWKFDNKIANPKRKFGSIYCEAIK